MYKLHIAIFITMLPALVAGMNAEQASKQLSEQASNEPSAPSVLQIAVITHRQVDLGDAKKSRLRRIFTLKQQLWADDTPIQLIVMPDVRDIHQRFTRNALSLFPYQLDRIWNQQVFSGLANSPVVAESQEQMILLVANTPGAAGYVRATAEQLTALQQRVNVNVIQ